MIGVKKYFLILYFSISLIIVTPNLFAQTTFDDPRVRITVSELQKILDQKNHYLSDDNIERINKTILKFPDDGYSIIDLVDRIIDYQDAYPDLDAPCIKNVSRTVTALLDIEDCIWRKNQILLKKYEFYDFLYDISYSTYSKLRKSAGIYSTLMLNGADYYEEYYNAKINILEDSYEMDVIYLLEILDQELTQKNVIPKNAIISNEPGIIGSGSGFFVTEFGHIITNNHVIDGCEKVFLNDETLEIIATDPYNDLAILKSKVKNNKFLYLKKTKIKKGEDVLVVGYPYGKDFGDQSKITKGIVSSLQGLNNDYSRIQIDAAIQPGNSGGPTLDSEGNVMGVTVSTASVKTFLEIYDSVPQNMNFAIKSSVVEMMLEANNISIPSKTNNSKKEASEIIKAADPATIYLECFGTPQQK